MNFGQLDWNELLPQQYKFINDYDSSERVRASKPPETKADCSVRYKQLRLAASHPLSLSALNERESHGNEIRMRVGGYHDHCLACVVARLWSPLHKQSHGSDTLMNAGADDVWYAGRGQDAMGARVSERTH